LTPGNGRYDRDGIVILYLCVLSIQKPDILLIEVYIHKSPQITLIIIEPLAYLWVQPLQGLEHIPDVFTLCLYHCLIVG